MSATHGILSLGLMFLGGVLGIKAADSPEGGAVRKGPDAAEVVDMSGPRSSLIVSRGLAKAGKITEAEERISQDESIRAAPPAEQDVLVALELWAMAQEARNQARNGEAVALAARAKRRLAVAARQADNADQVRIAKLRYELAAEYPGSEQEVAERLTELRDRQRAAGVVMGGEDTQ